MTKTVLPKQNMPADQAPPRKTSVKWIPLLLLFLLLYIGLNIAVYLYGPKLLKQGYVPQLLSLTKIATVSPKPTPSPTPTPTPIPRPIPHGKKVFSAGQSDKTVPQFSKGSIDPYDPANGATQTVIITVKHTQPVTKVTAILKTDHTISTPVPFTLTSGTTTNGTWQGSWTVTDTYLYKYQLVLQAESTGSKPASVVLTLR